MSVRRTLISFLLVWHSLLSFEEASASDPSLLSKAGETFSLVSSIETAQFRDALLPGCSFVAPSGDATGKADRANIQKAIDALQKVTQGDSFGSVLLAGRYYNDGTITCGGVGVHSRVCLTGLGVATIESVGAERDTYSVRMFGGARCAKPILSNLKISGGHISRGVLLSQVATQSSIENVAVTYTRQCGIDLVDCWCTNLRNVLLSYNRGYALRGHRTNGCHFDNLTMLRGNGLFSKTVDDKTLTDYAMLNGGYAAAKKKYSDAQEAWPAFDDTHCLKFDGTPYVHPDATWRCGVYLGGSGITFTNLVMEANTYVDYPLMFLHANKVTVLSGYTEANQNLHERILCRGMSTYDTEGSFNEFSSISANDSPPLNGTDPLHPDPTRACECFMRCVGSTRGNMVRRLCGDAGLSNNIITLTGATHEGTRCEDCATSCGHIPASQWIGEDPNTTVVNAAWNPVYR